MIYNTVNDIEIEIKNKKMICKLESRPIKYMFGTNNYGEILDTINPSDKDPWDVIIPGYKSFDINKTYSIKKLEGVIFMPNGNHKLVIDIFTNEQRKSYKKCKDEVFTYRRLYNKICRKRGQVIWYS